MKATIVLMVLACGTAARADPAPDPAPDDELEVDGVAEARLAAPPIARVVAAAYRAAGLEHDPGRSVVRRARLAGLVPWLTVRGGTNTSWHDEDPNVGRGTTVEVRATWRLDRLVFDRHELQVTAMQAARRRERRRLASRVIKAYFSWRRAALARSTPRAEEAEAELDALTDGWFSEARRTASETRTPCGSPTATP